MEIQVLTKQAQVDLNAAAVKTQMGCARQGKVLVVGLIFRNTATAAAVVTVKKYVLSNSSSGAVTLGTITKPASNVQGKYYYLNLEDSDIRFDCGDEIVFETTTDPSTSTLAECVLEYMDLPEKRENLADAVKVTV